MYVWIYRIDIDIGIMELIGTIGVNVRQSIYINRPDLFYRGLTCGKSAGYTGGGMLYYRIEILKIL